MTCLPSPPELARRYDTQLAQRRIAVEQRPHYIKPGRVGTAHLNPPARREWQAYSIVSTIAATPTEPSDGFLLRPHTLARNGLLCLGRSNLSRRLGQTPLSLLCLSLQVQSRQRLHQYGTAD